MASQRFKVEGDLDRFVKKAERGKPFEVRGRESGGPDLRGVELIANSFVKPDSGVHAMEKNGSGGGPQRFIVHESTSFHPRGLELHDNRPKGAQEIGPHHGERAALGNGVGPAKRRANVPAEAEARGERLVKCPGRREDRGGEPPPLSERPKDLPRDGVKIFFVVKEGTKPILTKQRGKFGIKGDFEGSSNSFPASNAPIELITDPRILPGHKVSKPDLGPGTVNDRKDNDRTLFQGLQRVTLGDQHNKGLNEGLRPLSSLFDRGENGSNKIPPTSRQLRQLQRSPRVKAEGAMDGFGGIAQSKALERSNLELLPFGSKGPRVGFQEGKGHERIGLIKFDDPSARPQTEGFFSLDSEILDSEIPGFRDPGFRDPGFRDPGLRDPGFRDPGVRDPWIPRSWSPRSWSPRSWSPRSLDSEILESEILESEIPGFRDPWIPRSWIPRSWIPRSWSPRSWSPRSLDSEIPGFRNPGFRDPWIPRSLDSEILESEILESEILESEILESEILESEIPGVRDPGVRDPGVRDPGVRDPGVRDPWIPRFWIPRSWIPRSWIPISWSPRSLDSEILDSEIPGFRDPGP